MRKGNARKAASDQEGRYLIANVMARSIIQGQRGKSDEWVFPAPHGGRMTRINNHGWRSALDRAALDIRLHDLRHTFGGRAEAAGVPWEYRKVLMGHKLADITAHYSAPGLARLLAEAEKITRTGAIVLPPISAQNGAHRVQKGRQKAA